MLDMTGHEDCCTEIDDDSFPGTESMYFVTGFLVKIINHVHGAAIESVNLLIDCILLDKYYYLIFVLVFTDISFLILNYFCSSQSDLEANLFKVFPFYN